MFIAEVIKALNNHKVDYAIVGGFAVALHGAVRGTVDVDLVIKLNKNAYRKAEQALCSINLQSRLPVKADDVFNFRDEYIEHRNLKAWSFVDLNNASHIVDIIITEDLSNMKTVSKNAFGMRIKVLSIDDLICMKKKSNRAQDRNDIQALEKIK